MRRAAPSVWRTAIILIGVIAAVVEGEAPGHAFQIRRVVRECSEQFHPVTKSRAMSRGVRENVVVYRKSPNIQKFGLISYETKLIGRKSFTTAFNGTLRPDEAVVSLGIIWLEFEITREFGFANVDKDSCCHVAGRSLSGVNHCYSYKAFFWILQYSNDRNMLSGYGDIRAPTGNQSSLGDVGCPRGLGYRGAHIPFLTIRNVPSEVDKNHADASPVCRKR